MKIYGDSNSGNCLKVKWVSDYLSLPYDWIEIDTMKGGSRTPEFLKLNGAGQVPVVILDDGRALAQSNAIIRYLARESDLVPHSPYLAAKMDEWLFWEQYSHEPYIAVARNLITYRGRPADQAARLLQCAERGAKALGVMEQRLQAHDWLTDAGPTIADLALFAYTHVADEGEFDLKLFPGVAAWVSRVTALPGMVTLLHPPRNQH